MTSTVSLYTHAHWRESLEGLMKPEQIDALWAEFDRLRRECNAQCVEIKTQAIFKAVRELWP